ncbi:MAG: hypothetical protein CMP52_02390 [Flavobacteriales bacterium]|nr:hypothetical protein [Candidatus Arcticimaribacter sp.]
MRSIITKNKGAYLKKIRLLFLLISGLTFAQTNVSGVVKDKDGEPIPFVNVFFSGSQIGSITDFDGKFALFSDQAHRELSISLLGYRNQKINLPKKRVRNLLIILQEGEQLEEVVVVQKPKKRLRKKENPAYPILKKIWSKKQINGLNMFSSYEYQKFTSTEVGLKNIDSLFLKKILLKSYDSIRYTLKQNANNNVYIPLNLKEKIVRVYGNDSLKTSKTTPLGERSSGITPKGFFFDRIQRIFQDIDVYKNRLLFADKVFESPLSKNGFAVYDYVLLDSIELKKEKLYTLYFFPRRAGDLAFTGNFTVSAPSYALTQINMRIDPNINLNLVSDLIIEKTYIIQNDSVYLPKSNRYEGDFSVIKKKEKGKRVTVKKSDFFDQYVFNKPKKTSFYQDQTVQLSKNEYLKDEAFWQPFENSENYSRSTRQILSEINENRKVKSLVSYTDFITGGYADILPGVQFGKWWNSFNNNDVEGNRLRLGFRTFKTIDDRFRSSTYVAHGFGDKKTKFAIDAKYLIHNKPRITFGMVYSNDFEQLGIRLLKTKDLIDFRSGGRNSLIARGSNYYLTDIERFGVNLDFGLTNNFHLGLNLILEDIASAASDFFSIAFRKNEKTLTEYRNIKFNAYLNYTPRRNVFGFGVEQKFGKNLHPEFVLKYSAGVKGILGGMLDYDKIQMSYKQTYLFNFLGNLETNLEIGKTYGIVPLPILSAIPSNQGYSLKPKTFALLNYYDMVADTYLMGHFEHHFNGFVSNKIPLVKKLKLRTLATFRFAYGSTTSENIAANRSNINYNSPDNDIYYEYGVGFENIGYGNIRFFRVDFIWRSPLSDSFKYNPYSSELPDFGIRIGAKPSL